VGSSCHVTGAAYSCEGAGASLNCSIYYILLDELLRTSAPELPRTL
jgi:hypothetical protein